MTQPMVHRPRRRELPLAGLRRSRPEDLGQEAVGTGGCLVLLRHAQSQWNLEHRFTGWTDVGLTEAGRREAARAAEALAAVGMRFDEAHTSRLSRAQETLRILLRGLGQPDIPVHVSWRLNERHYGALQGLDKREIAARYGEAQVLRWRRGYLDRPPALARDDARHPAHDPRHADLSPALLPATENLADTLRRLRPYWERMLAPSLLAGRRVLVSSHGNTLRALIMYLEGMSIPEVEALEIPTATPVIYTRTAPGQGGVTRGAA